LILSGWVKLKYKYIIFFSLFSVFLCSGETIAGERRIFRVASYNVENLFDLNNDGTEYPEYIPGSKYSWNEKVAAKKYSNISKVLADIDADIIALQEIENNIALYELIKLLKRKGSEYPFWAIADNKKSAVKCALISKFRLNDSAEIRSAHMGRSILKVTIDISGNELVIYSNHWPSKKSSERSRLIYAKALKADIKKLPLGTEYIITGDFNSDYNEFITFEKNRKLNDTAGKTGINHILKTTTGSKSVDLKMIESSECTNCLYNLWLEIEPLSRWSYIYKKKKSSLDNMIIPFLLLDNKSIDYVKGSFGKYVPDYVFRGKKIFRWQRTNKGSHIGKGFSDHLPVFADFKIENK